jgi:hypothetical protein
LNDDIANTYGEKPNIENEDDVINSVLNEIEKKQIKEKIDIDSIEAYIE